MIDPEDAKDLQLEDVDDYKADYPSKDFPKADENIHTGGMDDQHFDDPKYHSKRNYRFNKVKELLIKNKWLTAFGGVLFIVLIVIIIAASGRKSSRSALDATHGQVYSSPPVVVNPSSVSEKDKTALMKKLLPIYQRNNLDTTDLENENDDNLTPQRKAFYWLAHTGFRDLDHTELVQRYSLATFYYATNQQDTHYAPSPQPWIEAHYWISPKAHVCDWFGITCNSGKKVEAIELERNNLSGWIPLEVAFLYEHLHTLDLTSNLIFMEGTDFELFKYMTNLETLLLDDNYMLSDTALPREFKHMRNLEKLRMSYNLLGGELEKEHTVLAHLTKLTHLELESNFLSGALPPIISQMSNLIYLYMRRNEFSDTLDFLKTKKLENLFALWLDSNDIRGTIPDEIGHLSGIASLSITNATLTGSIPDSMGDLTGLRRLWLYSNKLTGTIPTALAALPELEVLELHHNDLTGAMPPDVCTTIAKAEYEYKALTADCKQEVGCGTSCCTECY